MRTNLYLTLALILTTACARPGVKQSVEPIVGSWTEVTDHTVKMHFRFHENGEFAHKLLLDKSGRWGGTFPSYWYQLDDMTERENLTLDDFDVLRTDGAQFMAPFLFERHVDDADRTAAKLDPSKLLGTWHLYGWNQVRYYENEGYDSVFTLIEFTRDQKVHLIRTGTLDAFFEHYKVERDVIKTPSFEYLFRVIENGRILVLLSQYSAAAWETVPMDGSPPRLGKAWFYIRPDDRESTK